MPKASPKRPSRSANRRIQPTASGTPNAAGSSQRVTTAPVRRLDSVSRSQCVGRAVASAMAASIVASAPGADRPRSGAAMSKRSTRRDRPRSAKKATAPIAVAAMPFAETPSSFGSRSSGVTSARRSKRHALRDGKPRRHLAAAGREPLEAHAERQPGERLHESQRGDRARRAARRGRRCARFPVARGVKARREEAQRRAPPLATSARNQRQGRAARAHRWPSPRARRHRGLRRCRRRRARRARGSG